MQIVINKGVPTLMTQVAYDTQCCCLCPCYEWHIRPNALPAFPCCGLAESYFVGGSSWESFGQSWQLAGGVLVYAQQFFSCSWSGVGGELSFLGSPQGPATVIVDGPLSGPGCFMRVQIVANDGAFANSVVGEFRADFIRGTSPVGVYEAAINTKSGSITVS